MRAVRESAPLFPIVALGVLLATGTVARPALASEPLAQIPFAVAGETLFEAPSTGAGSQNRSSWAVSRGDLVDAGIKLHVEIEAPPIALEVKSGPAVLFAGLSLYGDAGGDVAVEAFVPRVVSVLVPACANETACRYSADVVIPTSRLPEAIDRLEKHGKLIWVSADLTFVRTFGNGQWLQVLPLGEGPRGIADAAAGRLGAIEPTRGLLYPAGLFPASQATPLPPGWWDLPNGLDYPSVVEQMRSKADDHSSAIPMADVALHVAFEPACPYDEELFLHDDTGNHLFHVFPDGAIRDVDAKTSMPIGSPWYLSLDAGDGAANSIVRLGPIVATGPTVVINASLDCIGRAGTLQLTGAATPTPRPTASIAATPSRIPAPTGAPTPTSSPAPGAAPADDVPDSSGLLVAFGLVFVALGAAGLYRRRRRS